MNIQSAQCQPVAESEALVLEQTATKTRGITLRESTMKPQRQSNLSA